MRAYRVHSGQFVVHGAIEVYGQLVFFQKATHCMVEFEHNNEHGWGITIGFPWLVYFHLSVGKPLPRLGADRSLSLRAFSGAIWWTIWRDPMGEWNRRVPKWRDGNFNVVDFLLGDPKFSEETVEERTVPIPMPEGCYEATCKLQVATRKRRRWPWPQRIQRIHITNERGIPMEGKGENSWDCGTDASFGITMPARSIPEGVGEYVGHCLKDRIKRGGWSDWTWSRAEVSPLQLTSPFTQEKGGAR